MTTEYLAERDSAISWGAVIFGGITACAVTLFMLAVGLGIGFSMISPWQGEGVSATTFKISAGIFLVAVAMIAGAMGGFIAGRMRRSWGAVDVNEIYFRDSAHGFLVWAFATILGAAVLGGAATHIAAGAASGAGPAVAAGAQQPGIADRYVDLLLRTNVQSGTPLNPAAQADLTNTRAELGRLLLRTASQGTELVPADRTYVAQVISNRTGLSQAEAEARVDGVITQAKAAADEARKATAKTALWLAASMLAGALAAALAAIEGGVYRDSRWYEPGWRKGQGRIVVSNTPTSVR